MDRVRDAFAGQQAELISTQPLSNEQEAALRQAFAEE